MAGYEEGIDQTGPLYDLTQDNLFGEDNIISLDTRQTKEWNIKDALTVGGASGSAGLAYGLAGGTAVLPGIGTVAGGAGMGFLGFVSGITAYTLSNWGTSKSINDDPQAFADNVLYAMENPNKKRNY
jgi:hypothetical protein